MQKAIALYDLSDSFHALVHDTLRRGSGHTFREGYGQILFLLWKAPPGSAATGPCGSALQSEIRALSAEGHPGNNGQRRDMPKLGQHEERRPLLADNHDIERFANRAELFEAERYLHRHIGGLAGSGGDLAATGVGWSAADLLPLMLAAGDHARNDIAAEWKSRLEDAGHSCLLLHRSGRITLGAGDVSGTPGEAALSGENQRCGGV